jgi:uncharacterized protein YjbI with pentapeptide repeats
MGYRDNNNIKNGCFIHLPVSLVSSYITSDTTSLNFPYYIDYVKLIYAMCFEKNVSASGQKQWINLLVDERISAFNEWRMKNLIIRPDISGKDLSNKDLSGAYLNGVSCIGTNFSHCNLSKVNFVQADLREANLEESNLTDALLMYAEMKDCNLRKANLIRTNLMWANLQNSDLSGCKMSKTVLVEADMKNAKIIDIDRNGAYLKYAKFQDTATS